MARIKHLSLALMLTMIVVGYSSAQRKPPTVVIPTGDYVRAGVFHSTDGRFSIAIAELPPNSLDQSTTPKKDLGAGKQFVWAFTKTKYTAFYNPMPEAVGAPALRVFAAMESGTNTSITEIPIMLGKYRGTEFRYTGPDGIRYINRIYLVEDIGYQIAGGYAEPKYEREVLKILNSFKSLKKSSF